jgi:hypothetical protein
MTMSTPTRSSILTPAAGLIPWTVNLATALLARALNMPEPVVHSTGAFVFARVSAIENSVGKSLCPISRLRQFQSWLHRSGVW